jgi:hypothetical protein
LKNFDQNRIDLLLQYILVVAGQESGWDRELGMIHLIKYTYLADLTYSKYHKGETYTGLPWQFYHFGPWSVELYNRIEPALQEIGANKRIIESPKYDKDFARWSISDDQLFVELGNKLDLSVMGAVQEYVRRFGTDTRALLDYVYKTGPMVMTAPGELLDFSLTEQQIKEIEEDIAEVRKSTPTARQIKKREAKLKALKERINERMDSELGKVKECALPPRYDEIFFQGVDWLNSLAGDPIEHGEFTASISDKMWKSKARFDPDVSE